MLRSSVLWSEAGHMLQEAFILLSLEAPLQLGRPRSSSLLLISLQQENVIHICLPAGPETCYWKARHVSSGYLLHACAAPHIRDMKETLDGLIFVSWHVQLLMFKMPSPFFSPCQVSSSPRIVHATILLLNTFSLLNSGLWLLLIKSLCSGPSTYQVINKRVNEWMNEWRKGCFLLSSLTFVRLLSESFWHF